MTGTEHPAGRPTGQAVHRPAITWIRRTLLAGTAAVGLGWAVRQVRHQADAPDAREVYKTAGGHDLHLDVFRAGGLEPAPAILMFHGGAWAHGSPRQFHGLCRHLSELGLLAISVEYRIRSRHGTTPADAVQDARDAMRYLRRQAAAMRVDPGRIAAGGGSAGGHLAACLGTQVPLPDPGADAAASTRPSALVLLNPMLDLRPGRPDHGLVGADWLSVSPRQHVRPGLPPTLVLNGTADTDVPVATVQDFCSASIQAGNTCDAVFYEGAGHGFFNAEVDGGRHVAGVQQEIKRFLARTGHLAAKQPTR